MAKMKEDPALFSDLLRSRVRERLDRMGEAVERDACRRGSEYPLAAEEIGIAYSTLWRFLYRRTQLSGAATDKVMKWLEKETP